MKKSTLLAVCATVVLFFGSMGSGWGQQIFNVTGASLPSGWTAINNVTTNQIQQSGYFLLDAGNPSDQIITSSYDLSAYTGATLTLDVATYGSGNNNPCKIEVSTNGGTSYTQTYTSATPTSSTYISGGPINITTVSSTLVIRFSNNGTSGRGVRLQNLILTGTTSSSLTANPTSLSGFTYAVGGGPSNSQSYSLSGSSLSPTTGNITITPSASFEVSLDNSSFSQTAITKAYTGGVLASTTVFVRLRSGLAVNTYSETVSNSGGGASTVYVTCSGSVTNAPVYISAGNTITQNFTIGTSATATLPVGWEVDKNNALRTLGTYSAAGATTEQTAGNNMATGATNGIYNYAAGDPSTATDRAVGGLSSSSASKSVNVYVKLNNSGATTIQSLKISYNVEKYRQGSNAAGFSIQMYYSTDGSVWTSAGNNFLTSFAADADNNGYASAPGVTTAVTDKILSQAIAAGGNLYLAWNYSVTSGTTTSNAQALGIDDVSITAYATPTISGFTPTSGCASGGTSVIITGTNFTGATAVTFNGSNAALFTVDNATQISAVTPSGVSTGKIAVTTPGGTVQSASDFTVNQTVTPSVTIVASANPVTSGTSVAITATPVNGGTTPMYQFYVDGDVFGSQTANPSFSFAPPAGSYDIYVVMTPDPTLPCFSPATATSNTIILVVTASPATSTWTGSGNDHNWHNAANWDNGVPGSTTAVTIPSGLGINYPTVSSPAICGSITIESGASLINNGLLGIPAEQATVKREISDASDDNWHLFISPITQNIAATASSCFNGAYLDRYDEPSGEWVRLITGDNVVPGYGYSINYLSGSRDLIFTGTLKNSPLTYSSLSYTGGAPGYGPGWHLIGNPYPCGINPSLCAAPSNMNAYAYIWNTGSGNYNTLQFGSGTTIIAPLQGFFVRTTSATNSLTLANAAKTHGGTFYKNENVESEALVVKISGNNYSDQTIVRFNRDATTNFDQSYDAYKLWGLDAAPQLYSILPDENAAVNTLPAVDANPLVPLGLKVGAEASYFLTFEGMESFDSQIPLRLDDLKLGISKDLRTDPVYSFTAAPGDAENRFRLRFASAIGFDDPEASNILINSERNVVRINYMGSTAGTIYFYNNAGQLLSTKSLNQGETTMSAEATGIYLVKVITGKTVVTKKVVVVR